MSSIFVTWKVGTIFRLPLLRRLVQCDRREYLGPPRVRQGPHAGREQHREHSNDPQLRSLPLQQTQQEYRAQEERRRDDGADPGGDPGDVPLVDVFGLIRDSRGLDNTPLDFCTVSNTATLIDNGNPDYAP